MIKSINSFESTTIIITNAFKNDSIIDIVNTPQTNNDDNNNDNNFNEKL